jgi:glycosyltransferase involved in cell wall biosynthesis
MKIAFTGNVFPIKKDMSYGGERILFYLASELAEMNHEVYCFTREGSDWSGIPIRGYIPVPALRNDTDVHYNAVKQYEREHNIKFDIYQCNYFGEGWNPKILHEYHYVELTWCVWCHLGHQLRMNPFNTISYSNVMHDDFKNIGMDTIKIHYGIPEHLYNPVYDKEDYACWIGKLEGGKNPLAAIKLAKAAGMKLVIMAPPYNTNTFWQIQPYIDNKQIFWVRGVDDEMKQEIMSKAKCFIYTNDNTWKEHFGIVLAEALAMGTPVVAMNRINQDCSVVTDNIIVDDFNGFVLNYTDSNNMDEILEKGVPLLNKIHTIDKKNCREWFERRFTAKRMASNYNLLYDLVAKQGRVSFQDFIVALADRQI